MMGKILKLGLENRHTLKLFISFLILVSLFGVVMVDFKDFTKIMQSLSRNIYREKDRRKMSKRCCRVISLKFFSKLVVSIT